MHRAVILSTFATTLLALACSSAPEATPPAAETAAAVASVSGIAPATAATPTSDSSAPTSSADTSPAPASTDIPTLTPIEGTSTELIPAGLPQAAPTQLPRVRSVEELLRAEVASWRKVPYKDNGTTRRGISNAGFVRAVYRNALEGDLPPSHDQQLRTGKLVERKDLAPGDLVFFEGKGVGPFRSHWVALFLGSDQIAIAEKESGVSIKSLKSALWSERFRTARRIPSERASAPEFDAAAYGSTEELLKEVAKAWTGTLYKQGGTTFDGIGNDEFIRNIYEAIYDTELEGEQKQWAVMGKGVKRADLTAGDIILYHAGGLGNPRHAGMYIGGGEFVHALRGSAVTVSRLKDARWSKAYIGARRIDPDELARAAEARAARSTPPASEPVEVRASTTPTIARDMSEIERQLRDATEPWKGTPYKLGGTTKSGIDCSALVKALYQDVYEMDLPRTAQEQERLGTKVDRRALRPGDLVFFRTQGMGPFFKSRHVGVYVGNGEFAQASGRLGVNIARLDNYYWNRKYAGARRLVTP